MNIADLPSPGAGGERVRKPRIAFMGEFSAGKSTLSNMLIGASPLPVKVTATQLPPVWISYGDRSAFREDLEGNVSPVDLDRLETIVPDETRVIRIFQESDILELCDLIDMPGISDPNMSPDLWQRVIDHADLVVWCTHATQAWRQSEAAVWESMKPELYSKSLLLLTRYDKLLNDSDRSRVLKRVRRETEGLFADCFPISLTQALAAKDNREQWEESGAEAFMERLVELLHEVTNELETSGDRPRARPVPEKRLDGTEASVAATEEASETAVAPTRVVPRRVRPAVSGRPRPRRPERGTGAAALSEEEIRASLDGEDLTRLRMGHGSS